jgi:hypothetical protein
LTHLKLIEVFYAEKRKNQDDATREKKRERVGIRTLSSGTMPCPVSNIVALRSFSETI